MVFVKKSTFFSYVFFDFSEFFRISFFRSKNHFLLSRISKNAFFWLFLLKKKTYEKKVYFLTESIPFTKCRFFSTSWELHFWGPKSFIFYPDYKKMFLSCFFCSKKTYKKKVEFLTKNHGLTPLQMSIFSTFLDLHFSGLKRFFFYPEYQKLFLSGFSGLKRIVFYPEYQKLFVSGFLCSKKSYKKKVDFLTKTMDWPLCKKAIFLTLLELHFSGLKNILYFPEYQKLFLSGFFCQKKNKYEKGGFFDKGHGLTPLQNVNFLDFFRTSLFRSKKHSFLSRIKKTVCLFLFLLKKKNISEKGRLFLQKPWNNPFAKCRFYRLCENFTPQVWKAFFSIQNIKNCFFVAFFSQKKNI